MKKLAALISLAIILCCLDITLFSCAEKPVLCSLLAFYIFCILTKNRPFLSLFILVLLSLEYLIFYGSFFYSFLYFMFVGLIGYFIKNNWFMVPLYSYLFLLITVVGNAYILHYYLLGLPISTSYMFSNFFGTLTILILLLWVGFNN